MVEIAKLPIHKLKVAMMDIRKSSVVVDVVLYLAELILRIKQHVRVPHVVLV